MSNRIGKIKNLRTIKGLRGDTLTIDLGREYSGTLKAWFKKTLDSTTYRTFDVVDSRYLYLTAEKTSDYYNSENELQEAIAGKWLFDVELTEDDKTRTIFTGTLFFVNDVTGSNGEEAVYLSEIGGYVTEDQFDDLVIDVTEIQTEINEITNNVTNIAIDVLQNSNDITDLETRVGQNELDIIELQNGGDIENNETLVELVNEYENLKIEKPIDVLTDTVSIRIDSNTVYVENANAVSEYALEELEVGFNLELKRVSVEGLDGRLAHLYNITNYTGYNYINMFGTLPLQPVMAYEDGSLVDIETTTNFITDGSYFHNIYIREDVDTEPETQEDINTFLNGLNIKALRNFDITQWETVLVSPISVANNSAVNLFEYISESDKSSINSGNSSELSVTKYALGNDFIQMNWQNTIEAIDIRVILEIDQNGTDFFRVLLKRRSDDSIVSVATLSMNSGDLPENIATAQFITDIGGEDDRYITDGFYLEFANNSGQSVDLINNINVWINRKYQYSINS